MHKTLLTKIKHSSVVILALITVCINAHAENNQSQREVILNNDEVEVVRLTYPAGTESGLHSHIHPYRTVYFEQGGKLELIPADKSKKSQILNVPDGKILYLPANTHNVRNIGENTVIIVEHEIKQLNK